MHVLIKAENAIIFFYVAFWVVLHVNLNVLFFCMTCSCILCKFTSRWWVVSANRAKMEDSARIVFAWSTAQTGILHLYLHDYDCFPSKLRGMIYCCTIYLVIIFEQIFDRSIAWEDPTKWVILRYPWNKDHSRFLHTLRKLRQVDVVLNRNHLGSDNGEMILFLFKGIMHFQLWESWVILAL